MSNAQLQKLLVKWQKRLRLQDWDVTVNFHTKEEMCGNLGDNFYDWANGTATIRLLRPQDNVETIKNNSNPEVTLVHELLHILMVPITIKMGTKKGWLKIFEENTIEKMAKALVGV